MRIYAFHLLNDYSGSPKVLMQLAKGWVQNSIDVHLVISSGRVGFLSNIKGVTYHTYWYKWAKNPFLRAFNLFISQVLLFGILIFRVKKQDIIYINTVLPFGAAFLGKLKRCRIIYHIHETTMNPPILKYFLFGIAKVTAHDVIYVSGFLSKQEHFNTSNSHILYNAIETSFLKEAIKNRKQNVNPNNVLMVCSLKKYKGVEEFVAVARQNPQYQFRLVLNASNQEIKTFFTSIELSPNIELFDTQTNLHPFYQWGSVILNLSRPEEWVETFGLTILEGMAYGLPAIIPPVGGITALVEENQNGFLVDCRNSIVLNSKLNQLLSDREIYTKMAAVSAEKIHRFSEYQFINHSLSIIYRTLLVCSQNSTT